MTFARTLLFLAFCVGAAPAAAQSVADFPAVVTKILQSQTTGRISEMPPAQKQKMISCVNSALSGMPNGRKRYILEGSTLDEQEKRFGTVLYENRGEWVQAISHRCASVAMSGGGTNTIPPGAQRP